MSQPQSNRAEANSGEVKLLPGGEVRTTATSTITASTAPAKQLPDLPKDELEHFAEEFGLDPGDYRSRQSIVAAIHERRQMIAAMDRDAMLDVVRWGRRPVTVSAAREEIAQRLLGITPTQSAALS